MIEWKRVKENNYSELRLERHRISLGNSKYSRSPRGSLIVWDDYFEEDADRMCISGTFREVLDSRIDIKNEC